MRFLGYGNNQVMLMISLDEDGEQTINIIVGLDQVTIRCTCGLCQESLCLHAYIALTRFSWHDEIDLTMYYWPQISRSLSSQNKFLNVEVSPARVFVEPRFRYGNLFQTDRGFDDSKYIKLDEKSVSLTADTESDEVIGFAFTYSYAGMCLMHAPFIRPFIGALNKVRSSFKKYTTFINSEFDLSSIKLNDDQSTLIKLGNSLALLSEGLCNQDYELMREQSHSTKLEMFKLWDSALPLLLKQKFVIRYVEYFSHYDSPVIKRKFVHPCYLSEERPVLTFELVFKKDHLSLLPIISVEGKKIKLESAKPHCFIFDERIDRGYLMASVQDDELLRVFVEHGGRFTVFMKDFIQFHESFGEKLANCYQVSFVDDSLKVRYSYDFKKILDHING